MKSLLLPFALLLAVAPLAGCNQNHNKAPIAKERNLRGAMHGMRGMRGEGHRGLRRVCAADLAKYCENQERGRARRQCLQSHLDQLSADCKSAVEARGRGRRRRDFDNDSD